MNSSNNSKTSDIYKKEYSILGQVQELLCNKHISIKALWEEYTSLSKQYEQLLRLTVKLTNVNDKSQKKLMTANEHIENANAELALKNRQITDSIRYARRIQRAILPVPEKMERAFANHFIIYKSKDIVSGDFYWFVQTEHKVFIAVVDCTGHGVPGAFLSMIAHTLLNQIVSENPIIEPATILEQLHIGIRAALRQETGETHDGMDICLCQIDKLNNKIKFSGAKRPLLCVSQNKLTQIKGDRNSIGGLQKEEQRIFTNHEISVQAGDMLYLLTDGMADQNNPNGKKFGSRQLKMLLQEIASKEISEQKQIILTKFEAHQQQELQRDDVTLIGIRL